MLNKVCLHYPHWSYSLQSQESQVDTLHWVILALEDQASFVGHQQQNPQHMVCAKKKGGKMCSENYKLQLHVAQMQYMSLMP